MKNDAAQYSYNVDDDGEKFRLFMCVCAEKVEQKMLHANRQQLRKK